MDTKGNKRDLSREGPKYHTATRILSQLGKKKLFRREEKPNFNLNLLNCEETIAIAIPIFGYKEVYNVPYIGLH
jgi:hypothetical protein